MHPRLVVVVLLVAVFSPIYVVSTQSTTSQSSLSRNIDDEDGISYTSFYGSVPLSPAERLKNFRHLASTTISHEPSTALAQSSPFNQWSLTDVDDSRTPQNVARVRLLYASPAEYNYTDTASLMLNNSRVAEVNYGQLSPYQLIWAGIRTRIEVNGIKAGFSYDFRPGREYTLVFYDSQKKDRTVMVVVDTFSHRDIFVPTRLVSLDPPDGPGSPDTPKNTNILTQYTPSPFDPPTSTFYSHAHLAHHGVNAMSPVSSYKSSSHTSTGSSPSLYAKISADSLTSLPIDTAVLRIIHVAKLIDHPERQSLDIRSRSQLCGPTCLLPVLLSNVSLGTVTELLVTTKENTEFELAPNGLSIMEDGFGVQLLQPQEYGYYTAFIITTYAPPDRLTSPSPSLSSPMPQWSIRPQLLLSVNQAGRDPSVLIAYGVVILVAFALISTALVAATKCGEEKKRDYHTEYLNTIGSIQSNNRTSTSSSTNPTNTLSGVVGAALSRSTGLGNGRESGLVSTKNSINSGDGTNTISSLHPYTSHTLPQTIATNPNISINNNESAPAPRSISTGKSSSSIPNTGLSLFSESKNSSSYDPRLLDAQGT